MTSPGGGSRVEIFLGRLFISGGVFCLLLLGLEFAGRKFIAPRSPVQLQAGVSYKRHPFPYVMFGGVPGSHELNDLGYAGAQPVMPKPPGEVRIFMLGGSAVHDGNPPIPKLVENLFEQAGEGNVKLYNYGVVSSVSSMELARIIYEIVDLSPDMILFYNGGNDILQPLWLDPRPGYPFNFIVYENNPMIDKDIGKYPMLSLAMYGSVVLRKFFPSYFLEEFVHQKRVRKECGYLTPEWKEKIAKVYVGNIVKANKISRAYGAGFIAFFQPTLHYKDSLTKEELVFNDATEAKFSREVKDMVLRKVDDTLKSEDIVVVDLSNIYKDERCRVFKDCIHTVESAKAVVADKIFKNTREQLIKDGRIISGGTLKKGTT